MTKKIEVFASEAQQGELEAFPNIKRGWGVTKEVTGGIPPMKWFNAIQKRTDEAINAIAEGSISGYTFKDGATLESHNDLIYDDVSKSWYFWIGESGKVIPPDSNASEVIESDGGIWSEVNPDGLWVNVGDASLRSELKSDGGASFIRYKKPYDGAISRSAADYFNQEINIDDFGAKGDALLFNGEKNPDRTDDSDAIQKAIVQAWLHGGIKVTATPWKSYYVAKTIYTLATASDDPDAYMIKFKNRRMQIFDFQGARFIGRDDTTDLTNEFMVSGYLKKDFSIGTVFGNAPEMYLTYGTSICNVELNNFYRGFKFRNHIYGCVISNVITYDVQQVTYAERCFVSGWRSIGAYGSYTEGLARYHFEDNTNMVTLEALATGACDIGYKFTQSIEAVKMINCSIEGYRTVGVQCNGESYNLELDTCYIESNNGHAISATNLNNITLNNCWMYGNTVVFGRLGDNTNIRWMPNNVKKESTKIFDDSLVSQYNLSDFYLENKAVQAKTTIPVYDTKKAINVHQTLTAYNPAVGISNIGTVGKIEQCSGLQSIRVNGKTSTGTNSGVVVGSEVIIEETSDTSKTVIYNTGISYSDTQLIYVHISVAHFDGIWKWAGFIVGNSLFKLAGNTDLNFSNSGGKLVVKTPVLPGTKVTPLGGEIRII